MDALDTYRAGFQQQKQNATAQAWRNYSNGAQHLYSQGHGGKSCTVLAGLAIVTFFSLLTIGASHIGCRQWGWKDCSNELADAVIIPVKVVVTLVLGLATALFGSMVLGQCAESREKTILNEQYSYLASRLPAAYLPGLNLARTQAEQAIGDIRSGNPPNHAQLIDLALHRFVKSGVAMAGFPQS